MFRILEGLPTNFKLMVLNTSISRLGFSYFGILIDWITLLETNSAFYVGLVSSTVLFAYFLSIVVSAIVDKTRKRKITAYIANVSLMLLPGLIILSLFFSNIIIQVILLAVSSFFITIAADFLSAVRASWVKIFITSEEMYRKAVSVVIYSQTLFQTVGYALSSILLAFNPILPNLILILVFGLGLFPLIFIKYDESTINIKNQSLSSAVTETFVFVSKEKTITQVLLFVMLYNALFVMAPIFYVTLVYFKNLSSVYYGGFSISQILGLSAGSFFLSFKRTKALNASLISMLGMGIAFILLPFMPFFILSYIPSFVAGFFFGILSSITLTLITKLTPSEILARVQGFLNSFILGVGFVGQIAAGLISAYFSADIGFIILGSLFLLTSPVVLFFKNLKKAEV